TIMRMTNGERRTANDASLLPPCSRAGRLRQPDRLDERAVGRDAQARDPHPLFAGDGQRNLEALLAERRQIGGRDDLTVDLLPVTPDHFDEVERERPLDIDADRPLVAAALNRIAGDQDLARGHEVI